MSGRPAPEEPAAGGIKQVPQDATVREQVRAVAAELACGMSRVTPPRRDQLEELGGALLHRLQLPDEFLGFAMVAVSNAFWREQFEAVPTHRRLLLLPKCLRDPLRCSAEIDSVGLHCAECGCCVIHGLLREARSLGYETIVAEGTSSVIMKVIEGDADAILGVACLDSFDESFETISEPGVPNQALPLLHDGCEATSTETKLLLEMMAASRSQAQLTTRTAVPLLRASRSVFEPGTLDSVLAPYVSEGAFGDDEQEDPMLATEAIAIDWLRRGGKRLRPFVTVASNALGRFGLDALGADFEADTVLDPSLQALAVAIEAMHKASLVHDDIADHDDFRYGEPALHRLHGLGPAVNVGDWLVGLGFRLVSAQAGSLGHRCVAEILDRLSSSMLALCRGQGAELIRVTRDNAMLRPVDALNIGALKTAPAFEVALFTGLRSSGVAFDAELIRRFSLYLGEAYQVLNDLEDWRRDSANKVSLGRDVLTGRPTILRAFAIEAGGWETLATLSAGERTEEVVRATRQLYEQTGAFEKARALVDRLRERATDLAADASPEALGELMRFLAITVLRERTQPRRPEA